MDAPSLFAESLMEQGTVSFKNGAFAAAISSWSEAARLFEEGGNAGKYGEALTKLSQAYQGSGQHQDALKTIEKALLLAQKEKDERQTAEALGLMGNILTSLGENERAYPTLHEALKTARPLGDPDLSARILNNLGNLLAAQKKFEEALHAYQESASMVGERGGTAALALVNSATVSFSLGHYGEAKSRIDKALLLLRGLEDSFYKTHALINAGLLYSDLRAHFPGQEMEFLIPASAERLPTRSVSARRSVTCELSPMLTDISAASMKAKPVSKKR